MKIANNFRFYISSSQHAKILSSFVGFVIMFMLVLPEKGSL